MLIPSDPFPRSGDLGIVDVPALLVAAAVVAFVAVSARASGGRPRMVLALAVAGAVATLAVAYGRPDTSMWIAIIPACIVCGAVTDWRLRDRTTASRGKETAIAAVAFLGGALFLPFLLVAAYWIM